jgi:phenylacetate-CoA ligase
MLLEPEIETRPWAEQRAGDDALYRRQVSYLLARSHFYQEKLRGAGFVDPDSVAGLDAIGRLPFTEKDELRASRSEREPIGTHLAAVPGEIVRIYSTSGTTGTPSYVPLTAEDLDDWIRISSRSYFASGIARGQRAVTTYNAGPFVAGAALDALNRLGLCQIPVGTGNTERLMTAIRLLKPQIAVLTPSYALHLAEWARERGFDLAGTSVERLLVAGEPGGGEATMRAALEAAWGAKVTEAMGIGDISISLWGECEAQSGMHFSGRGLVHVELIDPGSGASVPLSDGAEGELVYTHLRHRAAPLLRFRSHDRVVMWTSPCRCGRTSPRVRCIGRSDDMLIVRGVNVFPTAVREVVAGFAPLVSGVIVIRPNVKAVRQDPPLPVVVELVDGGSAPADLAPRIQEAIRTKLVFTAEIRLVPHGTLPRSEYKSKLVEFGK